MVGILYIYISLRTFENFHNTVAQPRCYFCHVYISYLPAVLSNGRRCFFQFFRYVWAFHSQEYTAGGCYRQYPFCKLIQPGHGTGCANIECAFLLFRPGMHSFHIWQGQIVYNFPQKKDPLAQRIYQGYMYVFTHYGNDKTREARACANVG